MHSFLARTLSISICVGVIAFLAWASSALLPKHFYKLEQPFGGYYAKQARHFLMGRIDVDPPPPIKLLQVKNPYDYKVHTTITSEAKIDIWDHSFYNGKLYLYFGVAPALLLYTPYLALTGTDLKDGIALVFLLTLTLVGFSSILIRLKNLSYIHVPWWMYGVSLLLLTTSSTWPILLVRARTYEVPLASALASSVWGIFYLLSAYRNHAWNAARLACASLCFGLAVASRPHYLIAASLALLFVGVVVKKQSHHSLKMLGALVLPFSVVLAALGAYNYLRFDDVFEFGARYQLGTADLRDVSFFKLSRCLSGLYIVLFHPLQYLEKFPFFSPEKAVPGWAGGGRIFIEHPFGYFFVAPLSLLGMLLGLYRAFSSTIKRSREKNSHQNLSANILLPYSLFGLFGVSNLLMCSIWVAIIDRYTAEFAFFLSALTILILVRLATVKPQRTRNVIFGVLTLCAVYGCMTSHVLTKQWIAERRSP